MCPLMKPQRSTCSIKITDNHVERPYCFAMSQIDKWRKFAKDIKLKQTNVATKQGKTKSGETSKNTCGASILENKDITVQPLPT